MLLRNFWRWLCSPAAGLSNPALKRTVAGAVLTAAVCTRLLCKLELACRGQVLHLCPCQAGWALGAAPFLKTDLFRALMLPLLCLSPVLECQLQLLGAGLMRKVLAQLVASMRKLGSTVVAADLHGIILSTGKRNLTAAVGWVPMSLVQCLPMCSFRACIFQQRIWQYVTVCETQPHVLQAMPR